MRSGDILRYLLGVEIAWELICINSCFLLKFLHTVTFF